MFTSFLAACEDFHAHHEEWEDHMYLYGTQQELITFLRSQIQTDNDIQRVLISGTATDMDKFMVTCNTDIHGKFMVMFLTNFLDALHTKESLQEPFSEELVQWYRDAGWKFPQFACEK